VPYADLICYAYEGVIIALDKVNPGNEGWIKFVHRHVSGHTIAGALVMCGAQRQRTKEFRGYMTNVVTPQSDQLKEIIEKEQLKTCQSTNLLFEHYLSEDERRWFMGVIRNTVEEAILMRLFVGETIVDIARDHHMTIRTIKKFTEQLKMIYREAVSGNCVSSYLTPIETSNKYESLRITDDLRQKYTTVCASLHHEIPDNETPSPNDDPEDDQE
jgi:hypothetical protein